MKSFTSVPAPRPSPSTLFSRSIKIKRSLHFHANLSGYVIGPFQFRRRLFQPIVAGPRVRTEGFHIALAIIVKQRPMQAERARVRRVDERSRITRAHLKKNALRKFAQRLAAKKTADVVECVTGHEKMEP